MRIVLSIGAAVAGATGAIVVVRLIAGRLRSFMSVLRDKLLEREQESHW